MGEKKKSLLCRVCILLGKIEMRKTKLKKKMIMSNTEGAGKAEKRDTKM